jgi:hypothetical protein
MIENYGSVYEAFIDAYIKVNKCSREVAVEAVTRMVIAIEAEEKSND